MSNTTRISRGTSNPIPSDRAPYGRDREERTPRARGILSREGGELRRALERLRQLLASGQPLREDVPRGYYLNILV